MALKSLLESKIMQIVDQIKHSLSLGFGAYIDSEMIVKLNEIQYLFESESVDLSMSSSQDRLADASILNA